MTVPASASLTISNGNPGTITISPGGAPGPSGPAGAPLTPAPIKVGAYTAGTGDFVPCDVSGGSFTVTLPVTPADKSMIGVKLVRLGGTNTVTIAAGGTATFNDDGTTSLTLKLLNQAVVVQYDLALNVWYVTGDDLPLGQLDSRYIAQSILTTLGDTLYENGTPAPARLAGNTSATKNFLTQTGTGSVSAAPGWGTIAAGDLPGATGGAQGAVQLTGDLGGTAASPQVTGTHLASALPVAQGGTGAATQQAALDALAGAVTSGNYLRGNGTHVALAAIQAADLPAGTTSTKGALQLDGTAGDIQPIGVPAAGAKGQAADAEHVHPFQPWQFLPESFGAKRDGKFLYDAHMTGSSAVLTTAGLPAPSAPTVNNSGSGGTIAAGVYKVEITYVNQYGETLASSSTSTTTSGSSSTITISSPAPWTNATGWYAYVTQVGGNTYTRQQGAGSPTPLRTSLVLTAPPTSSGASPPGANTSSSAPFTAGDVGKAIVVPSAGGFLNVPLVTTIASYQSATQVTLTAASTSAVTGYGAVYGTDDTAAIQAAINAAVAYAQTAGTEQATAQVIFGDGIYCVAGSPVTGPPTYGASQITLPYVDPYIGPKVNLALTGPQEAPGPVYWEQPNPPAAGAVLACMRGDGSIIPGAGPASVIGGPIQSSPVFFGGTGGLFSNMRVIVDGLTVLAPYRPTYAGLDLFGVAQADIRSFSYFSMARTTTAAGGWPPYTSGSGNPSAWQVFGYRCPAVGNNAQNDCDRLTIYGAYYGVIFCDHFSGGSIKCVNTFAAAVAAGNGGAHHSSFQTLLSELTSIPLYLPTDGTYGGLASQAVFIASLAAENADFIIGDTSNGLYGEVHAEMASLTGLIAGGKNGAANIRLVWDYQPLGVQAGGSTPPVPATTAAQTNTFWRDALVTVTSGGAAVTVIAVNGTATGSTLGTTGSATVSVPSGAAIALTYGSTAPTWVWDLY